MESAEQPEQLPVDVQELLVEALMAYADPGFYFGCGFAFDRPTGGFDEDFSETEEYGVKPGKLARETLEKAGRVLRKESFLEKRAERLDQPFEKVEIHQRALDAAAKLLEANADALMKAFGRQYGLPGEFGGTNNLNGYDEEQSKANLLRAHARQIRTLPLEK